MSASCITKSIDYLLKEGYKYILSCDNALDADHSVKIKRDNTIILYWIVFSGVTLICTWSSLNKGSFQLVDSGSKYSLKWACYSEEIVEYAQKIDKTKAYSTIDDSNRYPSCDELCLRDVNCILYVKEFPLFEESSNRYRFNIYDTSLYDFTVIQPLQDELGLLRQFILKAHLNESARSFASHFCPQNLSLGPCFSDRWCLLS